MFTLLCIQGTIFRPAVGAVDQPCWNWSMCDMCSWVVDALNDIPHSDIEHGLDRARKAVYNTVSNRGFCRANLWVGDMSNSEGVDNSLDIKFYAEDTGYIQYGESNYPMSAYNSPEPGGGYINDPTIYNNFKVIPYKWNSTYKLPNNGHDIKGMLNKTLLESLMYEDIDTHYPQGSHIAINGFYKAVVDRALSTCGDPAIAFEDTVRLEFPNAGVLRTVVDGLYIFTTDKDNQAASNTDVVTFGYTLPSIKPVGLPLNITFPTSNFVQYTGFVPWFRYMCSVAAGVSRVRSDIYKSQEPIDKNTFTVSPYITLSEQHSHDIIHEFFDLSIWQSTNKAIVMEGVNKGLAHLTKQEVCVDTLQMCSHASDSKKSINATAACAKSGLITGAAEMIFKMVFQ